ncbi:MAG: MBL fold metallo-hydrolase [Hungatella sp.]|nr:MBL fold metallo-hydrolase [Hungatella sp.]
MKDFSVKCCVLGMVSTNCYIVYKEEKEGADGLKQGVIIDPGDNAPYILNRCRELEVRPKAILLTHGHFDHILAAEDIRRTFHIPVMASEEEVTLLEEPDLNLSASFGDAVSLTADRWLKDGETLDLIGRRWRVIHTPGHTAGCLCFYIQEEGILFSGDTLFRESVGRTDLPTASPSEIIDSVVGKLWVLPEDTKVYPGHDEQTDIGHEKKYNVISRYRH